MYVSSRPISQLFGNTINTSFALRNPFQTLSLPTLDEELPWLQSSTIRELTYSSTYNTYCSQSELPNILLVAPHSGIHVPQVLFSDEKLSVQRLGGTVLDLVRSSFIDRGSSTLVNIPGVASVRTLFNQYFANAVGFSNPSRMYCPLQHYIEEEIGISSIELQRLLVRPFIDEILYSLELLTVANRCKPLLVEIHTYSGLTSQHEVPVRNVCSKLGIKALSQFAPVLVSYNSRSSESATAAHALSQELNSSFNRQDKAQKEYLVENLTLHRTLAASESSAPSTFSVVLNHILGPTDITHIAERGIMLEINDALFVDEHGADGSPSFCWFDMRYNFEKLHILKGIIEHSLEQFY